MYNMPSPMDLRNQSPKKKPGSGLPTQINEEEEFYKNNTYSPEGHEPN